MRREFGMSKPLEEYGIIGNMISAALVGRDGSIDWLCLPRFDSGACFAALLGSSENGRWRIAPETAVVRSSRSYVPKTAVLETCFETDTGRCTVIDFMPLTDDEEKVDVVRIVRGDRGEVPMQMELILRFNYGQAAPWVRRRDYGLSAISGPHAVELHTPVWLDGRDMKSMASFTVRENQTIPFTLSYHRSHKTPHFVPDRMESLDRTVSWWREWSKRCSFDSGNRTWRDAVLRSLITLKLLTYRPTGGIVAAPTTSLPEGNDGSRNWDYRYCWLRDSALTLYALLNAGYRDEAEAWRQWLLRAAAGRPDQLRIMYGIAGERWLPETEVPWLPGYGGSGHVRVGNQAAEQLQLDVYGELVETLHAGREAELAASEDAWRLERVLLNHLVNIWQTADHGIWEVRGPARAFTHSRVMVWVALDRAIESSIRFGLEGPIDRWRELRDAVCDEICEQGFNRRRNSFVQYYGGDVLDASLLLIPQVGLLRGDDWRVAATVSAIEKELVHNGFVHRYRTEQVDDGIGSKESAFIACSFWLADAYVMLGRFDDAENLFSQLLTIRNDLGLLAEEYDPIRRRLIGNFPQGFSHIGLINTAFNLVDARGPAHQRSQKVAPPSGDGKAGAADRPTIPIIEPKTREPEPAALSPGRSPGGRR
jgi:GH15 family glucan-1,4-alpha-glucosidase